MRILKAYLQYKLTVQRVNEASFFEVTTSRGGHWGGLNTATPQHRKKFCRTPHHRKKSRWITVTAISIFSLMILASVQDKAFKILPLTPLTLRKSLKQHITRPKL